MMSWCDIRQTAGMVFQNPDNQLVCNHCRRGCSLWSREPDTPEEIRRRVDDPLKGGYGGFGEFAPTFFWRSETADSHRRNYSNEAGDHNPDEPTAMLDPAGRREVMETIRYLNREEGITIVHITHYMEEAIDAHRLL